MQQARTHRELIFAGQVAQELGTDCSGMQSHSADTASRKRDREKDVGGLCVPVPLPLVVALLSVNVVKEHRRQMVTPRRDVDNARSRRTLERRQDGGREKKRSNMI